MNGKCIQIQQLNENGQLIAEYVSLKEASEKTGVNFTNISACCKGKRPFAGGF